MVSGALEGRCRSRWRALWPSLLAVALALAVSWFSPIAESARAVGPHRAIKVVNKQRAMHGIPGGVRVSKRFSAGCRKHDRYLLLNSSGGGITLTHEEDPGRPGYTKHGDFAGRHSVLSAGAGFGIRKLFRSYFRSPSANAFETAPLHLAQVLDPALAVSGFDVSFRGEAAALCLTTLAGRQRAEPKQPVIHTYPGPGRRIYRGMTANESPYAPGDLVGLPQRRRTGPTLYVFVDGPERYFLRRDTRILSARLRTAGGRGVRVKTVDNSKPIFNSPASFVIPVRPLRPNTRYLCTVRLRVGGKRLTHRFAFRTTRETRYSEFG